MAETDKAGAREFHKAEFKLDVLLFAISDPMGFARRATDAEMEKRVYEFAESFADHRTAELRKLLGQVELGLRSLCNEVKGALGIAEPQIRAAIGNTNVVCIENRLREAEALLSRFRQEIGNGAK